ncbi:MAG: MmgE/PrpD family protein [Peptococcaceae bacterium]
MSYTDTLAQYIANFAWEEVPKSVREKSKIHILDTLGVALGGSITLHAGIAYRTLEKLGGNPHSTVIGKNLKTSLTEAAFLNALMAHSIDFDDGHKFVHPGAAVITTALSIAEHLHLSGKKFITSVIVGYDTSIAISLAAGVEHRKLGYHPTGTCNFLGACAAAGHLLNLSVPEVEAALGIAGTQAAGLAQYRFDGSPNKHLHAGIAARGGILAALLAQGGYKGAEQILEGEFGFLKVLSRDGKPEKLNEGLGKKFAITETDIKPYPSCRQTHTAVDLAIEAIEKFNLQIEQIEEILVEIYDYANQSWLVDTNPPQSGLQAMLNIPYCLAVALLYGKLNLTHFSEDVLKNERVHNLARKIKIKSNEEFSKNFPAKKITRLNVKTENGSNITLMTENPKGSSENPLTFFNIVEKFHDLADGLIGKVKAEEVIVLINNLEKVQDVAVLAALLGDFAKK